MSRGSPASAARARARGISWLRLGDSVAPARRADPAGLEAPVRLRSPDLDRSDAVPLADLRLLTFTSRRTPPELAAW